MATVRKARVGFVGFGEVNTPKELIVNRCAAAARMLEQEGLELFATAPVCDDPQGREAARARAELAKTDFDLVIGCIGGGIPPGAVFGVIEPFKHKPMVLWGLTGWPDGDRFVTTAD